MRVVPILVAAALAWALLAVAQEGPKTPTQNPPGQTTDPGTPASPSRNNVNVSGAAFVDEMAPDFELDGSKGRPVRLSKLRGDWVVMVFAERRSQFQELATVAADLKLLGGIFLGVCDEKARSIEKAQVSTPLPFLVAADPTGEVSAMYGVYDRIHTTTGSGFFVIDRHGVVRLAVIGQQVPATEILSLARIPIGAAQ